MRVRPWRARASVACARVCGVRVPPWRSRASVTCAGVHGVRVRPWRARASVACAGVHGVRVHINPDLLVNESTDLGRIVVTHGSLRRSHNPRHGPAPYCQFVSQSRRKPCVQERARCSCRACTVKHGAAFRHWDFRRQLCGENDSYEAAVQSRLRPQHGGG